MTSDYTQCSNEKLYFLQYTLRQGVNLTQPDFKDHWSIAFALLSLVRKEELGGPDGRARFVKTLDFVPSLGYLDDLLEYLHLTRSRKGLARRRSM